MSRNRTWSRNGTWIRRSLFALVVATPGAWSADPTPLDVASERVRLEAQYAFRFDVETDPELDPVVFTEIVPFTADETPVRLPPDQDLD